MAPKLCSDVEIDKSVIHEVDPKIIWVRETRVPLEHCDQVVKVGEGWVDMQQVVLVIAGLPNEQTSFCITINFVHSVTLTLLNWGLHIL
jgi:hypothetical protein